MNKSKAHRHRLSVGYIGIFGEFDFLDLASENDFQVKLETYSKKGESEKELTIWFMCNVERIKKLRYLNAGPKIAINILLSAYLMDFIVRELDNIAGMDDKAAVNAVGVRLSQSLDKWHAEIKKAESTEDMQSLSFWKGMLSLSEESFNYLKSTEPRSFYNHMGNFMEKWYNRIEILDRLRGKEDGSSELSTTEIVELSQLIAELGNTREAISILGPLDENTNRDILLTAAQLNIKDGRMKSAKELIDKVGPSHPESDYVLGQYYERMGQSGRAFNHYKIYVERSGPHSKQAKEGLVRLEKGASKNASIRDMDTDTYLEMDAEYERALSDLKEGNLDSAKLRLRELRKKLPDNPMIESQYALVLILTAQFEDARLLLKKIVFFFPDYVPARRNLNVLDEIEREYAKDPDYLRRLRENLVSGRFGQEE